jgi:hypothetical protein
MLLLKSELNGVCRNNCCFESHKEGELKIEKLGKDKSLPIAGFYYPSAKSKAPHDELNDTESLEQDLKSKLTIESDVSNGTKLKEEFEDDEKEGDEEEKEEEDDEEDSEGRPFENE